MSQQAPSSAATTVPQSFLQRHRNLLIGGALLLAAYVVAAATLIPPWLVSLTAGKADANTQLSAVTSTRAALLGAVTPIVVLFGAIAAFLNYQETADQNRRTNERAEKERDEARRIRRANTYANLLVGCADCVTAAENLYFAKPADENYVSLMSMLVDKRHSMDFADDQVMLLGSDSVQAPAKELNRHIGEEIVTNAFKQPRLAIDEWKRRRVTEYAQRYKAFLDAARADLAPTR